MGANFDLGALLSSRLSLIIAASAIALNLQLVSSATNSAVILLAIITCTLSPILFNKILPVQGGAVRFRGRERVRLARRAGRIETALGRFICHPDSVEAGFGAQLFRFRKEQVAHGDGGKIPSATGSAPETFGALTAELACKRRRERNFRGARSARLASCYSK